MTGRPDRVRLAPLEEHEWTQSTRDLLQGSWLAPGQAPPKPSTVRATLARHLKLFEVWDPFGSALFNGELPDRDREVIVLRTAWLTRCEPEWAYHAGPAARAGITSADVAAIIEGPRSSALGEWDRVLVGVVDQLREQGSIDDATWERLATRYTPNQLIEVPMVAGHYLMIAYALNSFGTPVPEGLPSLPRRGGE
jgi:AhpD family alkylhydroperoxidase